MWFGNSKLETTIYAGMRDVWSSNVRTIQATGEMHLPYIQNQNRYTPAPRIRFREHGIYIEVGHHRYSAVSHPRHQGSFGILAGAGYFMAGRVSPSL